MGGIFLGFVCALALLVALGRLRASRPPDGWLGLACWSLVALTCLDGLNAFLADGDLPHVYAPNTSLRLITGLGAGLGLGLLSLPVVFSAMWARAVDEPALGDLVEVGVGLALLGLLAGVMLAAPAPLLWPLAVAMVGAVLLAFGLANAYVLALVSGRARQAACASDLSGLLLSGLGLALLELAALSAARSWLASALGLTWGF